MGDFSRVSIRAWLRNALTDENTFSGIEFYELSDAPMQEHGLALLAASCARLRDVCGDLDKRSCRLNLVIPYIKFKLPSSGALLDWRPAFWEQISADNASLELVKDGCVFAGWNLWESHHVRIALDNHAGYHAIFRRSKGVYESEVHDEYQNEIFIVPCSA